MGMLPGRSGLVRWQLRLRRRRLRVVRLLGLGKGRGGVITGRAAGRTHGHEGTGIRVFVLPAGRAPPAGGARGGRRGARLVGRLCDGDLSGSGGRVGGLVDARPLATHPVLCGVGMMRRAARVGCGGAASAILIARRRAGVRTRRRVARGVVGGRGRIMRILAGR